MDGPVLETPRLILRPPAAVDLEAWISLMADPEAARFIGGVQPRYGAWRGLMAMAGCWRLQGFGMFSVIERGSGRWIGRVGPWRPDGWPGDEVGWGLVREAWGQGYAREAASAAMGWAFDVLGWAEIIHLIHPENARSRALAARLGSTLQRRVSMPPPFDGVEAEVWAQDARTWREGG
jgi:RimJ/RimL family protein N-acetyltransferase